MAPEARHRGAPDQWHLAAETVERSTTARFMAVMLPHRADEEPPGFERLEADGVIGARVGSDVVLAPKAGVGGAIRCGEIEADAALIAVAGGKLLAAEATRLVVKGKTLIESDEPVTVVRRAPRAAL